MLLSVYELNICRNIPYRQRGEYRNNLTKKKNKALIADTVFSFMLLLFLSSRVVFNQKRFSAKIYIGKCSETHWDEETSFC